MTREELLKNHKPTSMILIYKGPYSVSDFFAYAIIRKAFFDVFSRYPGFYTTKNMEKADAKAANIDFITFDHKQGVDTEHTAVDAWDEFGHILVSDKGIFDRVREHLQNFVDNATADYQLYPHSSGLSFMFGIFNSQWCEDNDALYDEGRKKMFYIRKKTMVEGIVTASKILERIIISAKNDIELEYLLDRAYEASINGREKRLMLIDEHQEPHVILVISEPCHIHNVTKTINLHSSYADNIRIFIQANVDDEDSIIGYVAQVVDHNDGFSFNEFYQYCKEKLSFDAVNMLSDNGMVVGINSSDLDCIVSFCACAYIQWHSNGKIVSANIDVEKSVPTPAPFNFTSSHDEEPEVEDVEVKVEQAHNAGYLYDPLKDKLSDLSTKFLHLIGKEKK